MSHNNDYLRRAYRHWFEDGIGEIAVGMAAVIFALWLWLTGGGGALNIGEIGSVILTTGLIFGLVVLLRLVINRYKASLSYPRTGFVTLRPEGQYKPNRVFIGLLLGVLAGLAGLGVMFGLLYAFAQVGVNVTLLLFSLMLAVPAFITGWRTGLYRFYVVGGLIVGLSVMLTAADTFGAISMVLLYAGAGILVIGSGTLALVRFLRTNPPVNVEAE